MFDFKGKKYYSGTDFWSECHEYDIDKEGRVTTGSFPFSTTHARIAEDGTIYTGGDSWLSRKQVGRIDKNGNIYMGSHSSRETHVGSIDKDGKVYAGTTFWNKRHIGSFKD